MSTINIDDVPNEIVPIQETTEDVTIHQPPPSYSQISTQSLLNPQQYRMLSPSNDLITVTIIHDARNSHSPFSEEIFNVHEHTLWSLFSLIFCCIIIGGCALTLSCKTREKKHIGDLLGARNNSNLCYNI